MSNRKLSTERPCCPHCGGSLAPAAPRRPAAGFAGHDDFHAALAAATARAVAAHGPRWPLIPAARVMARVPAAWSRYRIFRRTVAGRRDLALPAARFWPNGVLPIGADYASEPAVPPAPGALHRAAAARCERERDDALAFAMQAARGINPAAERRERARWIDAAHAAERAMFAYVRLADRAEREPPAPAPDPTVARLASKRRARDARLRRGYAGLPSGPIQEAFHARSVNLANARHCAGADRAAYLQLAWEHHRDYLAALRAPNEPPAPEPEPCQPPAPVVHRPVKRGPEPAADPVLLAWWRDAVANWRAYQSPADHAALTRCQDAMRVLLAALPDRALHEHMVRAVKAGRQFPARWFATPEGDAR